VLSRMQYAYFRWTHTCCSMPALQPFRPVTASDRRLKALSFVNWWHEVNLNMPSWP
jgi:hypothetical protein